MSNIKITWYGHACFVLGCDGFRLAIDPYDPTTPGYKPLSITANRVLCSHHHHDHCYLEAVCMPLNEVRCPFTVEKIKTYHDGEEGALRGENTIHIISAEGYRIAHFGDLGHMLDAQQIESLGKLDLALVPVGGTIQSVSIRVRCNLTIIIYSKINHFICCYLHTNIITPFYIPLNLFKSCV